MNQQQLVALIAQHTPKPKPKAEEQKLLERIRALAPKFRTRLFRNTVGVLKDHLGRRVTYGLGVGSSDLVGYRVTLVTPEMVGQKLAVFVAVEVKKPGRDTTQKEHLLRQQQWIDAVIADGGIGGIVRSEEELLALLRSPRD